MKSRKPAPSSTLCCLLRASYTCSVTSVEVENEQFATSSHSDRSRHIVAFCDNLVAEIWLGEHRQWTESEASCIVL